MPSSQVMRKWKTGKLHSGSKRGRMKTKEQIQEEIKALGEFGRQHRDDPKVQASVQGQIDALMWVSGYECTVLASEYA